MGVRPVSRTPLSFHRLAVPDHHLEQTPSASTNARGSGFPEYFIYSPPRFFLFALLDLVALPFSLSLHLACSFFTSRLRLNIDALLLLRF